MKLSEIFAIIEKTPNPYPLELVTEQDAVKLAKELKEILKDRYSLVEQLLWVWGNFVFELAKRDIEHQLEMWFDEKS